MRRASRRLALLLLALAFVAPAGAQDHDDPPDIELEVDLVIVNVVVTRGQQYATGLTMADFSIAEDGRPQQIQSFGAESTPFAAAILLDTSGSMEYKLRLARVAAARFMERARPEDRISLYLFGSHVRRLQDFTPGGRDLHDGVWDTSAEGVTKMHDAVGEAVDALEGRAEVRRAIILISDGADFGSALNYDEAVRRAQAAGVTAYTIDVAPVGGAPVLRQSEGLQARSILRGLADKSGGQFFVSKNGSDLGEAFARIVEELGNQYTLTYQSTNAKRDGAYRKIAVTCARDGVKLRARDGYTAPKE